MNKWLVAILFVIYFLLALGELRDGHPWKAFYWFCGAGITLSVHMMKE